VTVAALTGLWDPLLFVGEDERSSLKPHCLIIDVSCDEGMGFFFAKPTSFESPMFKVGLVDYYAVDHTPSYLWESASRSISAALIVHLPTVLEGHESWQQNETIRHAVNVDAGVIQKSTILSFQKRQPSYPHAPIDTETT
jgi:N5-(carboxyethyl)ornithine synthase